MRRLLGVCLVSVLAGCGVIDKVTGPDGLSIEKFVATPSAIDPGTPVTLSWDVSGAETVTIDGATVKSKGELQVLTTQTKTFVLTAKAGTNEATASVQIVVAGSPEPSPSPSASPSPSPSPEPSPTPSPTPTPSPSPTPSPEPTPTPTPSPEPSPSPTPAASACGVSTTSAGSCPVTVEYPQPLEGGDCVEVTQVTVSVDCPVAASATRYVQFDLNARTASRLSWRRAAASSDVVTPTFGTVASNELTSVTVTDIVNSSAVAFEVVDDQNRVRLRFSLKNN